MKDFDRREVERKLWERARSAAPSTVAVVESPHGKPRKQRESRKRAPRLRPRPKPRGPLNGVRWKVDAVKRGVCVDCGDVRGPGSTKRCCARCSERRRVTDRRRTRRLRAEGLCRDCSQPRGGDGTVWHCKRCATRSREATRARRLRLIEQGLCAECGKARGDDGTGTRCRICAIKNKRGVAWFKS